MRNLTQETGVGTEAAAVIPEGEIITQHEQGYFQRARRIISTGAAFIALSGSGGLVGASVDDSPVTLGPHEATVELALNSYITGDFGFPGAVRIPVEHSVGPVGTEIRIQEIPDESHGDALVPSFEDLQTELSPQELERYGTLYASIQEDSDEIKQALFNQSLKYTAMSGALLVLAYKTIGKRRLQELGFKKHAALYIAASSLLLSSHVVPAHSVNTSSEWRRVGPEFVGTPFEKMEVRGKIMRLVIPAFKEVYDLIEENDLFYKRVIEKIEASRKDRPLLMREEGLINFSFITDNHCNIGMLRVVEYLRNLADTDLDANGGDITFAGTEAENPCTQNAGDVAVEGNHDDEVTTRSQLEERGTEVLSGAVVEIAGIRILGDADPRRSEFGKPTYFRFDETLAQMGERLKNTACNDSEGVDLLLVHDKAAGLPALEAGCVPNIWAGHSHQAVIESYPNRGDENTTGIYVNGGTTGGSTSDRPTIGPLQGEATLVLGQINEETGALVRYRVVTVQPSGHVSFGVLRTVNS